MKRILSILTLSVKHIASVALSAVLFSTLFVLAATAQTPDWVPAQGSSWWWQLNNTEQLQTDLPFDVYDIDLFEGIATGKLAELLAQNVRVICYFSAGTFEPGRPDSDQIPIEAQIDPLPDFPDERWLRINDPTILTTIIEPVMAARIQLAADSGCNAVEPDNVDGYDNAETNGLISAADQLAYNVWLADQAHARGLSVGLKNDLGQLTELVDAFDFAVNEQCYAYGNECTEYESTFLAQGKAVFNQEYFVTSGEGSISEATFSTAACDYFNSRQISALWKSGLDLNGQGVLTCVPPVVDSDGDGVSDAEDNCSSQANPLQIDTDADGYGNTCDADYNNDCTYNFLDYALLGENFLGAAPLYDHNGDGAVNFLDFTTFTNNFLGQPGPSGLAVCDADAGPPPSRLD